MSSTDNRGIPIVQPTCTKRKLPEDDDEITLYFPTQQRRMEYFRTSSPKPYIPSSPRPDSTQQHALTEPIIAAPQSSPLRSSSFTSSTYMKPRNASLIRNPKRKPDELELTNPKNKVMRNNSKDKGMYTPSPTRPNQPATSPVNERKRKDSFSDGQKCLKYRRSLIPRIIPTSNPKEQALTPPSTQPNASATPLQQKENITPLPTPEKDVTSLPTTQQKDATPPTPQKDVTSPPTPQKDTASPPTLQKVATPRPTTQQKVTTPRPTTQQMDAAPLPIQTPLTTQALQRVITRLKENEANESGDLASDSTGTSCSTTEEERIAEAEAEAAEIAELMKTVKCLPNYYKLISKIGEGTFSTVYKALDIRRSYYQNKEWEHVVSSMEEDKSVNEFVALKRIYNTSAPHRIANEIQLLRRFIGKPCISPLITAFRENDEVFVVMPYIQNDDFRSIFSDMDLSEIKCYMRCMFTALNELSKLGIIHRDLKPNNFLYNRRKRVGFLIDLGLAECEDEGRKVEEREEKIDSRFLGDMAIQSSRAAAINRTPLKPSASVLTSLCNKENRATSAASSSSASSLSSSAAAVTVAVDNDERVQGFVRNDARRPLKASRAGTRGFRAPEVLFRLCRQTCAVDVWSAGVIFACFLTGRYPFFISNEDSDAIIELAQVYGTKEMKQCAHIYGRTFSTNINIPQTKIPWQRLAEHLNREKVATWDPKEFREAVALLEKALDLDCYTRITAEQALEHPFLRKN